MNAKTAVCSKRSLLYAILGTVFAILFLFLFPVKTAQAAGFSLYTDSSGVSVKAGESLSFPLYVSGLSQPESEIDLAAVSMPDGFTGFFKRNNYEVSRVHASAQSSESIAAFQLTVPREISEGRYEIVLKATDGNGQESTLALLLQISELQSGESNFTVEYPDQEGVTGTSFTYSTTIANNTLTDQTYSFSYDAPAGWQVSFGSGTDGTQISSVDIASGSSQGITITATPPERTQAGDYEIKCSATSSRESLETALHIKILGTYDLELGTSDGRLSLDANANRESTVTLRLTNSGNIDLSNVNLTSNAPTGWEVTFNESTVDVLEAGATKEIQAKIKPGSDALTGDYLTVISASSTDQTASAEFRITVKTQTSFGIVAILIILAVIAGLYYVVKKYGRR